MADNKQNNGVRDKVEHFDLSSTEQVELSDKGNTTTIRISTNMK
jgi:hypothetical protein